MRLYYSFVTGITGWIGITCYEYGGGIHTLADGVHAPSMGRKLVVLALSFLGWGINQIVNDYLGLKEDGLTRPSDPWSRERWTRGKR